MLLIHLYIIYVFIYLYVSSIKNNQNRSRAHIPAHAHSHSGQKMMKYFPADLFRIRPRDCKQVNSCTLTSSCSPGLGRGLEPTLKSLKNPAEPSSLAGRDFSISSPAAGCWWKSRRWSSSNLPAAEDSRGGQEITPLLWNSNILPLLSPPSLPALWIRGGSSAHSTWKILA